MKDPNFFHYLKFILSFIFSRVISFRLLVWLIYFIISPIFYYNVVEDRSDVLVDYVIENKHQSYNDNGEKKYNFNVVNADQEKETIIVEEESYVQCNVDNIYTRSESTTLFNFYMGFVIVFSVITAVVSFGDKIDRY